jgi:phage terminase large subunit
MSDAASATRLSNSDPGRPYEPFGAARTLFASTADEILLSGPAGTGKSRACLELLYYLALKRPGMRGLILRKTRESLTEAALVTFEDEVVPAGDRILRGASRRLRQAYRFANGSSIVVGGLDKSSKVMSTQYDVAYVQEAIELTEEDWENVTTRLRHRVIPGRQQLFADTNPDKPTHWLKRRCDRGLTRLIECRHTDNPVLYDHARGEWTPAGIDYLGKLDRLSGPRKARLRDGRWVQAEGVVYDGWDAAIHVVDRFPIPKAWRRIISIDFGWNNPFVAQFWAIDPDDVMYLYREIYRTQRLVEDHARHLRQLIDADGVPISGIVCDHDAEGRETLTRHLGQTNFAADKGIQDGIQAVASRLRVEGNGKPRLVILRDSLVERDPRLSDAELPCCTVDEIDGYVWDTSNNRSKGEVPVDRDNHGMDAMRYAVRFVDRGAGAYSITGPSIDESPVASMPAGVFSRGSEIEGILTREF